MRFVDVKDATPLSRASILRKRKRIGSLCRRYGINLLFLHGSLARDRHGSLSDVDLALSGKNVTLKKIFKIEEELSRLIGREDLDLACLNRASSLLRMQVLEKGVPLYVRNKRDMKEFRYRTIRDYLDSQALRQQFAHYVTRALL